MMGPNETTDSLPTTKDFHRQRAFEGKKVGVINLGCARNLVDSQEILGRLKKNGHRIVDVNEADIAIVNTCAFIEDAKRESIDTILDMLELKKQGKIKKVIVAGCLAQRYGPELAREFRELDAVVGTPKFSRDSAPDQVSLTPGHFAYVKICESCYNQCRFCVIPKIKGKFSSRTIEAVLSEVRQLDRQGVREINLIGQDITAYGMDLYREYSLARLLREMVKVTRHIRWIRLLYAFPAHVTDELIDVIAAEEKICKYIDMPLQHISDPLLERMDRNITTRGTRELVDKIRKRIPQGTLRTTFIAGLPGETEADFQELREFVRAVRFEKMGVFIYSREEGTPAYGMPGQVPEAVKRQRMHVLMEEQKKISRDIQQQFIGRRLSVLIEERLKDDPHVYLGRSEYDAPDVDGLVYVHSRKPLRCGSFTAVRINDATEYDLTGEPDEYSE